MGFNLAFKGLIHVGICGGVTGTCTGFFPITSFFPHVCAIPPTLRAHSFIHRHYIILALESVVKQLIYLLHGAESLRS